MTNEGGTVRYHRAEFHDDGRRLAWDVEFTPGGPQYVFTAAEGEAMGLTPPEPAPLVVTCNGHSIDVPEWELDDFIAEWGEDGVEDYSAGSNRLATRFAYWLRDARQDPQPASDDPVAALFTEQRERIAAQRNQPLQDDTPGIDFDALPDGTVIYRPEASGRGTRIKVLGHWRVIDGRTVADPLDHDHEHWKVAYRPDQPAPLSPGECLRGLLAGRTDADELIEAAKTYYGGVNPHSTGRWLLAIGDAAREVHG